MLQPPIPCLDLEYKKNVAGLLSNVPLFFNLLQALRTKLQVPQCNFAVILKQAFAMQ